MHTRVKSILCFSKSLCLYFFFVWLQQYQKRDFLCAIAFSRDRPHLHTMLKVQFWSEKCTLIHRSGFLWFHMSKIKILTQKSTKNVTFPLHYFLDKKLTFGTVCLYVSCGISRRWIDLLIKKFCFPLNFLLIFLFQKFLPLKLQYKERVPPLMFWLFILQLNFGMYFIAVKCKHRTYKLKVSHLEGKTLVAISQCRKSFLSVWKMCLAQQTEASLASVL